MQYNCKANQPVNLWHRLGMALQNIYTLDTSTSTLKYKLELDLMFHWHVLGHSGTHIISDFDSRFYSIWTKIPWNKALTYAGRCKLRMTHLFEHSPVASSRLLRYTRIQQWYNYVTNVCWPPYGKCSFINRYPANITVKKTLI